MRSILTQLQLINKDNPTTKSDEAKNNSDKKEEEPNSTDNETGNENRGNENSFGSYLKIVKTYFLFILVLI